MKQLRPLSLIIALLSFFTVRAQSPGDNCMNAINITSMDTCTASTNAARIESWYIFNLTMPSIELTIRDMGAAPGTTDKWVLYSGTCNNLMPVDSVVRQANDTVLKISRHSLPPGFYYAKAEHSGPMSCRTCFDPPTNTMVCLRQEGNPGFCGFDFFSTYNQANSPGYSVQSSAQDQYIYNYVHSHANFAGPFTIPVVVHVLHYADAYGSGNNISYDQIRWQIAALNAAFQHQYAIYNQETYGHQYTYGIRDYSTNPEVRFCLATIGRDSALNTIPFYFNSSTSQTESGVMRYDLTQSPYTLIPNAGTLIEYEITNPADEQALLDVTRPGTEFPNGMYMNIYLVPDMCEGSQCNNQADAIPSIVGVGSMIPSPAGLDGVVFRSDAFGDNSVAPNNFNLFQPLENGKIMDHEAGHYLSLYHPFEPDSAQPIGCWGIQDTTSSTDRCDQHGDYCCDTPPDAHATVMPYYSISATNTCNENYFINPANHIDMNENYMDYSDDEWYNTFTFDQSMRISAMLDVGGPRHSLVTQTNLTLTGVSDTGTCSCCILAANIAISNDTTCVGATVNFFTPSGTGLCANSWVWQFPGGTPSSATGTNASTVYSSPGTYLVILTASDGSNSVTDTATVVVIIPTVTITNTNTNLTVCQGTQQNIYLQFAGNQGPYSVSICNAANQVVATMNNIVDDTAIILVPVTATDSVFHICSATTASSCQVDTIIGTTLFHSQICCPNLFKNGDFEDWGIGCIILPATTQQVASGNCNLYAPSHYGVYNPSAQYGGWPAVQGNSGINGLSMVIDGWPTAQIIGNPSHTELWHDTATIVFNTDYSLQFDYSGNYGNLYNSSYPPLPNFNLYLQLKINGTFVGSPIHVPGCSVNSPWRTFVMDWTSNLPTGDYDVSLCQVFVPNTGFNFDIGNFDYLIDNITMRSKDIPTVYAGLDTLICPGGTAVIGSLTNDSNGVYTWQPNNFVTCDTCYYTTANPDSTYEYVLVNQLNGCTVRDTVLVQVLNVFAGNDTAFCGNSSVTLNAIITGNAGGYTILWQPGSFTTNTITVSPTVTTVYVVTVTDTAAGCSATDTIVVSPNNLNISIADTTICLGSSVTLAPTVSGNIGSLTYLWLPGNQTSSTITVSPTVQTTYSVIVSDSAGCSDTAQVTVFINSVTASLGNLNICPGDTITLTPTITGGIAPFNYLWQPNGQTSSTINVSPLVTTSYTFTVTDSIGCSDTAVAIVTPNNMNVLLAGQTSCNGSPVTLTPTITGGNGPFTYLWLPGNQVTPSISFSPSASGNYTVIVTDNSGCSDSAVATVTLNSLTATLSNASMCIGNSVTLSPTVTGGIGQISYLWLPGNQTSSSISVSPTVVTVYTVIVTDSTGCSDTAQATVNPLALPVVSASANPNPACVGSDVQLTSTVSGNGSFTYLWSPATNLSATNISNPVVIGFTGSPNVYSVQVTDINGCSASATVSITADSNCCVAAQNAPQQYNNTTVTGSVAVNQNLTIAGTVTFNAVDMPVYSGVTITVGSGATLLITGQSHLYACQQLWKGIHVQTGGTLVINGTPLVSPLLEDADTLIHVSPGSIIVLNNAIFNKNFVAAELSPNPNPASFQMTRCRITSRQFQSTPSVLQLTGTFLTAQTAATLRAPLTGQRPYTGIDAIDVAQLNVGLASSGTLNIFDNMDHGIIVNNTNLDSRNNQFQNMLGRVIICQGPPAICPPHPGIAILAFDNGMVVNNPATFNTISVGGAGANRRNFFYNCYTAVDVSNYVNIEITNDTVSSQSTVILPANVNQNGDHGYFVRTRYAQVLNIRNNGMLNQATGIHLLLSGGGQGFQTVNVNSNNINAGLLPTTFTNTGILAAGLLSVYFASNQYLNIDTNQVVYARTCISAMNFTKNGVRIENNPLLWIRPITTTGVGPNQAGVLVQNCATPTVISNSDIRSLGTTYSNPNHRNVRGIYIRNSASPTVACNRIRWTGQSLVFEGACGFAIMRKNDMSFAYDGFVMRNSAVIGIQGDATHPIDNRWLGGFVNSQTLVENTNNINSPFLGSPIWVRAFPAMFNPTNNLTVASNQTYVPNTVGFVFVAAVCPATGNGNNGNPQFNAQRRAIAQNQINYAVNPVENRVSNQKRLWSELQQYPSLMAGDTALQNFSFNNQNTPIGQMNVVEDQAAVGNINTASSVNATMLAANNPEYNQQALNDAFLNTLAYGIDSLSPQQMNDLTIIANQCPEEGGDAVWQARAMLDWVLHTSILYSDSCNSSSRLAHDFTDHSEGSVSMVNVYPNPNAGIVTVNYQAASFTSIRFEVWDVSGRMLKAENLSQHLSQAQVDLNEFANGTYVYKFVADDRTIRTGLLIISK